MRAKVQPMPEVRKGTGGRQGVRTQPLSIARPVEADAAIPKGTGKPVAGREADAVIHIAGVIYQLVDRRVILDEQDKPLYVAETVKQIGTY